MAKEQVDALDRGEFDQPQTEVALAPAYGPLRSDICGRAMADDMLGQRSAHAPSILTSVLEVYGASLTSGQNAISERFRLWIGSGS